jgi:DNA-binding LacI/PurR family transcriptional regulator
MEKKASICEKASEVLQQEIGKCTREGSPRLPQVRTMALKAGVSVGTMIKTIKHLQQQHILTCIPGSGVYVSRIFDPLGRFKKAPVSHKRPERHAWQRSYQRVLDDLRKGVFDQNKSILPSLSSYSENLGVSVNTMKRALVRLVREGVLVRHRRSYRVAPVSRSRSSDSIVLVTAGFEKDHLDMMNHPRYNDNYAALEHECAMRGVRLLLVIQYLPDMAYYLNGARVYLNSDFINRYMVLGFIVWTISAPTTHLEITARAPGLVKVPVAVLNESDETAGHLFGSIGASVFTMGMLQVSGLIVGRYFSGLGHRNIAYIGASSLDDLWTRRRLDGLIAGLAESVQETAVLPLLASVPHVGQPFIHQAFYHEQILPRIRSALEPLHDIRASLFRQVFDKKEMQITAWATAHELREIIIPLLERAAANPSITAWICENDQIALIALDYLREHGVAVPREISVLGFDDTVAARTARLSTYNFNSMAVARAMVSSVLKSPDYLIPPGSSLTEMEGMVIERNTTAVCRNPGTD